MVNVSSGQRRPSSSSYETYKLSTDTSVELFYCTLVSVCGHSAFGRLVCGAVEYVNRFGEAGLRRSHRWKISSSFTSLWPYQSVTCRPFMASMKPLLSFWRAWHSFSYLARLMSGARHARGLRYVRLKLDLLICKLSVYRALDLACLLHQL